MAQAIQRIVKGGSVSFGFVAGAVLLAALVALASVGGDVPWLMAVPLGLIAWIMLKPKRKPIEREMLVATPVKVGDTLDGVNSKIEVRQNGIAISRHGAVSFVVHGLKGEKLIPYTSITSVQFKAPGKQMAGYLQFGVKGGIESSRGIVAASGDENTVLFEYRHRAVFLGLREFVEARLATAHLPNPVNASAVDQLTSLSKLREAGHLTREEFETEKAKILSA